MVTRAPFVRRISGYSVGEVYTVGLRIVQRRASFASVSQSTSCREADLPACKSEQPVHDTAMSITPITPLNARPCVTSGHLKHHRQAAEGRRVVNSCFPTHDPFFGSRHRVRQIRPEAE